MSIYEEIGGRETVRATVHVFYGRVTSDPLLTSYFAGIDLDRLEAHQRAFLAAALGGPDLFSGRGMAEAHAHLDITDEAFDAIVEHLAISLRDLGAPEPAIHAVRERLEPMRADVVTAVAAG
ncbi:MAG: group 1 truncated hemoglobin [Microbacteriaceae bacterium]|nr:group 1 truncated hemoglobin [Microbacteriaceae bacterium]